MMREVPLVDRSDIARIGVRPPALFLRLQSIALWVTTLTALAGRPTTTDCGSPRIPRRDHQRTALHALVIDS